MKSKKLVVSEFIFFIIVMIFTGVVSLRGTFGILETFGWIQDSQETVKSIDNMYLTIKEMETDAMAFVVTGNQVFQDNYNRETAAVYPEIEIIKKLTKDKAKHESNIEFLEMIVSERLSFLKSKVEFKDNYETDTTSVKQLFMAETIARDSLRNLRGKMLKDESMILSNREKNEKVNTTITMVSIGLGLILTIIYGIISIKVILKTSKRIIILEKELKKYEAYEIPEI